MKFDSLIVSISLEVRCNLCLAILIFYGNDITEKLRLNYIYFVLFNSNSNNIRIQQLEVHLYDLWSLWWVNKLVFLIYYLSPFYLDLISFYLILFPFSNYFSSIASYYISETNIWRLSLGAKERGLGDDSGWKYEIWDKNMSLPKVRDMARPVPPAARPCQPSGHSFAASASWTSYLSVYFWSKIPWFLVEHSSYIFLRA